MTIPRIPPVRSGWTWRDLLKTGLIAGLSWIAAGAATFPAGAGEPGISSVAILPPGVFDLRPGTAAAVATPPSANRPPTAANKPEQRSTITYGAISPTPAPAARPAPTTPGRTPPPARAKKPAFREAATGMRPTVRAEWSDPVNGATNIDTFTGDFLIAVPPAAKTPILIAPAAPWKRVRLAAANNRPAGPWIDRIALPAPTAIGTLASVMLELEGESGRVAPVKACFCAPWSGSLGFNQYGNLRVADAQLGLYRPPARSGAEKVRKNPNAYTPPRCFIPVRPETFDLQIAGRLRVADLVVPSEELKGARPCAWTPVHYPLWRAVETLRTELAARGLPPDSLKFLSCFRPPDHNARVGSGAYGRHIYGDACDFYVDADNNGMMDDLNRDGRVDRADGVWLALLIEDLMADGKIPVGGIGVYTFDDSPRKVTMHFDLRGHRARWGYHTDVRGRKSEFTWQSARFAAQDAAEKAELEKRKRPGAVAAPARE